MLQVLIHLIQQLQKDFIALKDEGDKLNINNLVNVPTSQNNVKAKVDDLDVGELKTLPINLKQLSDVVDKQIDKNAKFNTLEMEVNELDRKFLMRLLLFKLIKKTQINKIFRKKIEMLIKKTPNVIGLVYNYS